MTESMLTEIHADLEVLKKDVAQLKAVLLGEGEINETVKQRIENYKKYGTKGFFSQEAIEKEFA